MLGLGGQYFNNDYAETIVVQSMIGLGGQYFNNDYAETLVVQTTEHDRTRRLVPGVFSHQPCPFFFRPF